MAKAVIGGVLQHVSASQLNTWTLCARKWWYAKVAGIPEATTPNLELGTRVHAQMEDYYLKGIRPEHPSARLLIDDCGIPTPGPGILIEYTAGPNKALGIKAAGVPVSGAIDLVDERGLEEGELNIWDWKTTKFLKYAKRTLNDNLQLNIYGRWAFEHYGERISRVRYHHGNIQTSDPGAKVVSSEFLGKGYIDTFYESVEGIVSEMKETAAAPDAASVSPNKSACWEFNKPCPYLNKCQAADAGSFHAAFSAAINPTPEATHTTKEHEPVTSLKERIAARKAAQSTAPESAPVPVGAVGINPPDAAKPAPVTPAEKTTGPAPTPTVTPSPSAVASGTDSTPLPAPGAFSVTGLTLLVDCHGVKGIPSYTLLEEEIARRAEPIAKAAGVMDVRQVRFGEGTAALVASFLQSPPSGVVLAYSGGLSQQVVEALTPVAALVIRGSR